MMIRDIFADDINRLINGVIQVDQAGDDVIEQELNEYVITKELKKHFITFFPSQICSTAYRAILLTVLSSNAIHIIPTSCSNSYSSIPTISPKPPQKLY